GIPDGLRDLGFEEVCGWGLRCSVDGADEYVQQLLWECGHLQSGVARDWAGSPRGAVLGGSEDVLRQLSGVAIPKAHDADPVRVWRQGWCGGLASGPISFQHFAPDGQALC